MTIIGDSSRRTFLRTGIAVAAAGTLGPTFGMKLARADDSLVGSLAASIGGSLARGAIGSVGSFAFGQMMSAIGLDTSGQAEMNAKLDEILSKLDTLQAGVDKIQSFLGTELTQMQYDAAFARVEPLIVRNKHLNEKFRYLLSASSGAVGPTKVDILLAIADPSYQSGLATWNDALMGTNGLTSLIVALSRAVFNKQQIFNQKQAALVQQYWDYIDAHQALTVSYIVDYLNATKRHDETTTLISTWYSNRAAQIALLRGVTRDVDVFPTIDGKTISDVRTPLNALPKSTLYSRSTGFMWFTQPLGPAPGNILSWASYSNLLGSVDSLVQTVVPSRTGWGIPHGDGGDIMKKLAQDCGVDRGGVQAFIDSGFELDGPGVRIVSTCNYVQADPVDVADCGAYGSDANAKVYFLAARELTSDDSSFTPEPFIATIRSKRFANSTNSARALAVSASSRSPIRSRRSRCPAFDSR